MNEWTQLIVQDKQLIVDKNMIKRKSVLPRAELGL